VSPLLCALLLTVVGLLCTVLLYLLYYVYIAVLRTLAAGLLARSQYPEGPATGHLGTGFSWSPCVSNAEMVPKTPSCHYMLLM